MDTNAATGATIGEATGGLVLLDNRDSFTYNLYAYLRQMRVPCTVLDSYACTPNDVFALQPAALILSPGPGRPENAGCLLPVLAQAVAQSVPTLGVCLGLQAIGMHFGAQVVPGPTPLHGITTHIRHTGTHPLYAGISQAHRVMRYHSLVVAGIDEGNNTLEILATTPHHTAEGRPAPHGGPPVVMALAHRTLPVYGVQYHPESVLTRHGHRLLANFCALAGVPCEIERAVPPMAAGALDSWRRAALGAHPPGPPAFDAVPLTERSQ